MATLALASCSKSLPETAGDAAKSVGQQLMQRLLQKDASAQARRMAEMVLSNKPECEVFKERMKEAGKGSPYEGATQWKLVHTSQFRTAKFSAWPGNNDSAVDVICINKPY